MSMAYSSNGRHLTEQFEGCKLKAYRDSAGIWTCGYGHTKDVGPDTTCTGEQADAWLADDVKDAASSINRLVKVPLTQNEFDALVDFVFNLGAGTFAKSTMLTLLNAGDHHGAAAQFERFDKAGGVVVAGLLRRRQAEESLFVQS